jgi:hypothetical protein
MMNTQSKQTFLSKGHKLVDEDYLSRYFKIHPINHRVGDPPSEDPITEPDARFIESGLVLPRMFILEFTGTILQLANIFNEDQFKQQPLSVHGLYGEPLNGENHGISHTTDPSEDVRHLTRKLEQHTDDDSQYRFFVMVQTLGQIALPLRNLQSAFLPPDSKIMQPMFKNKTMADSFIQSKL